MVQYSLASYTLSWCQSKQNQTWGRVEVLLRCKAVTDLSIHLHNLWSQAD